MSVLPSGEGHVLLIGSAGLDIVGRAGSALRTGTSNPGHVRTSPGGVARNVAENLCHLGMETVLITAVGDDAEGEGLLRQAAAAGVNVDHTVTLRGKPTSAYLAVLDCDGNLLLAMDDMRLIEEITPEHLKACRELFERAAAVFVDGNLAPRALAAAFSLAGRYGVPVAADPTSASLAPRFLPHLKNLWLFTPNESEAEVFCPHPVPHADRDRAIDAAHHLVSQGVGTAVITMAESGVGYASAEGSGIVAAVQTEVLDPTGAGDALSAAVIFALLNEIPLDEAVRLGASAATLTLRTTGSVVPDLSLEMLYDQLR
jgi:pseudouridine kinase